ncbi:hypothetical protein Rh054_05310 [Rickettsia conorii subsp. heilongjiangensis 054]|uniref:Uncharacterized protein n=1 Tax=Rickettsia argasii T170-B TaxID=1268837 RepID=A0A0F3RIX8_9RICK|nr:hypothetical protein Rh054_05310 [Rickettsia conorii subsp. heilongjiangensis 054]KJW05124.1 hypothetical protein RAT170B_0827 [Rickettsia argasii T170-B]
MTKKLVDNKIAPNKAEYDNLTEDNGLSLRRIKVVKG